MYQVSRAIYRELSCDIRGGRDEHEAVLHACEATIERMVVDHHYFARPARTLFRDLRPHFDIALWPRVWHVVFRYVTATQQALDGQVAQTKAALDTQFAATDQAQTAAAAMLAQTQTAVVIIGNQTQTSAADIASCIRQHCGTGI